MRILCETSQNLLHIHRGWEHVFKSAGFDFLIWKPEEKPAFDAFDEVDPHLFIGCREAAGAVAKCVDERVKMAAMIECHPQPAADTRWIEADETRRLHIERGDFEPHLACFFGYVGNYRPNKARLLDAYIRPLADIGPLKVFGRVAWPFPQYLGACTDETTVSLYEIAALLPHVAAGGRTGQRVYQALLHGGACISNILTDGMFDKDTVPQASDAKEFHRLARHLASGAGRAMRVAMTKRGHAQVVAAHTYWHRCRDLLLAVGLDREAAKVMEVYRAACGL